MAGPISPGNYWYDSRAGFWGAVGSYCLGIIPPYITEFEFPMDVDCAGGNTDIYVNGRELHEKDLDLLASRGLPRTTNEWYIIDISGKVQVGDTVMDLGKLAPSVEKCKRGFGMSHMPSSAVLHHPEIHNLPPSLSHEAKADVFVNEQPLLHHVVTRAEKMAGPILPGNYWYDSRAGFWGAMGGHCLGIIPLYIEEFEFPMVVDCAGGNTDVYVNGRELHEKDLKLLASRGLPCIRNESYIIGISGEVMVGDTLINLGTLAPSVEKLKHGYGMYPP